MEKQSFVAALTGSIPIAATDLIFPDCYHSCFTKQDNSLPFIKNATRRNGKPAFILSAEEEVILADPLKHTLICKFSARLPSFELIRKHVESLRLSGPWRIGFLDNRHVMFKLELEQDYAFLFTKKLHRIENVLVKFLKWTADFDFKSEPPIAPVWIKFPGLKLHLFHKQFLFSLATVFGKPLKLDLPTFNLSRPSSARVLVEMDVSYSYSDEIWIGSQDEGYWQEVVFDSKPLYCSNCRIFGHCLENCFITKPHLRPDKYYGDKDHGLNVIQNSVLIGNDSVAADEALNLQSTFDGELHLSAQVHNPNTHREPQSALHSSPQDAQPKGCSAPFIQSVTGFAAPVTGSDASLQDHQPGSVSAIPAAPALDGASTLESNPSAEVFSPSLAVGGIQAQNNTSPIRKSDVLGNVCTTVDAQTNPYKITVPSSNLENLAEQTQGKNQNLHEVISHGMYLRSAAIQVPTHTSPAFHPNSSSVPLIQPGTDATATYAEIDHQPIMRTEASSVDPVAVFSTVRGKEISSKDSIAATSVSVVPISGSVATLSRPNTANNFISDQGNTDSDSYETYTGSYREEDLQLNEACKEVFEEWQEEWEFQKSKKKQKGFRELKNLFKDKGTKRATLGSRRSLSGHL